MQVALSDFVEQASVRLQADIGAGHEVPFELDSHNSRGRGASPLYCYRPLTGAFIAERFVELRRLEGYAHAAELIEGFEGLDRYLLARDAAPEQRGARAQAALLALLKDVFDEQSDFEVRPERLDRALERLDGSLLASATEVTLVASIHGLTIASEELQLTRGLLLARPDALQGAPAEALCSGDDHLLVVFVAEGPDPRAAIAQGRDVLRELLRALRLFGDGRIALGALAWSRIGVSAWSTVALGLGGRPHGMLVVTAEQEDELRAFCNLISRRAPHASELAWALRRFEMGCERAGEYEAISDYLPALRVLLGASSRPAEPYGVPDGLLAARLAALCAAPEDWSALVERTLKALALEREAIAGKAVEYAGGLALVREISNHLRALLRDVICGHLPSDLASLADELLRSGEEPGAEALGEERLDAGALGEERLGEEMLGDGSQPAEVLHVTV